MITTCAIWGIEVVTKYFQFSQSTYGHLSDVRHEIVRNTLRVLSDLPRLVSTDRVEVPQYHNVPVL